MSDLLTADIIIASLSFLQNLSYKAHVDKLRSQFDERELIDQMHRVGRQEFGPAREMALISRIFWHRIVCDEFHELGQTGKMKKASEFFLKGLRARFYVGVTGTPQYNSPEQIAAMARYLDADLPTTPSVCIQFLKRFVRRNEPNLQLPELTQVIFSLIEFDVSMTDVSILQRIVWVDMTAQERGLYMALQGRSALMACNHYQLADEVMDVVGDENEMTINEVSSAVQDARLRAIARLETEHVVRPMLDNTQV